MNQGRRDRYGKTEQENHQHKTGETEQDIIGDARPEHPHLCKAFGLLLVLLVGLDKCSYGDNRHEDAHGFHPDPLHPAQDSMAELVHNHGDEEPEPDGKCERNEIVHARDRKHVLEIVCLGQGRPLDHDMLDGKKEHKGHEG